jgi:hypothetical protein
MKKVYCVIQNYNDYYKKKMISTVISHSFFNGVSMEESYLDMSNIISHLPRNSVINTNIKTHNFDNNEFLIIVKGGKIKNLQVIAKINKYLKNNSARSYFYEGLVSSGNGNYYLNWGS